MSEDREVENTRLKVRSWLMEQGYILEAKEDPNARWGFIAMASSTREFGFYIGMYSPHTIQLSLVLPVDDFQKLLDAFPANERREFLYDLRMALLGYDVDYEIPENSFSEIRFATGMFIEGSSRRSLFDAVGHLRKAVSHTVMFFEKRFGFTAPQLQFSGKIH